MSSRLLRVREDSMTRGVNLSTSEHGGGEVARLIARLDASSSAMKKTKGNSAKAAIKDFATYYFDNLPELDSDTVGRLVERLVQASGAVTWKQMRELKLSSVHALELLARLLDPETNQYASEYRNALGTIPIKSFRDMKLDKHLTSSNAQPDVACLVVSILLELRSDVALESICDSTSAQRTYRAWEDEQNNVEENVEEAVKDDGRYFTVKVVKDPTAWCDVNIEDLHKLVEEFNDPNDDSEDQVKKNREEFGDAEEDTGQPRDPLGIKTIDSKTLQKSKQKSKFWAKRLRLTTKKRDSAGADGEVSKTPAEDAMAGAVDSAAENDLLDESHLALGSISPYDEDFNPVLYLLDVHRSTPFPKLRQGLDNLRKVVNNRQNLMRELVQDHFDQFVSCKDAIDSIHELLSTEVELSKAGRVNQSNTGAVIPPLKAILQKINTVYTPLFQRKEEADRIRHALTVLKRHHLLFSMPGQLTRNIKMRRYDAAVRDYRRVTTFRGNNVDLLEQVVSEIHRIVDRFRDGLLTQLYNQETSYDDQLRLIGYLVDLDCKEDPAWHLLGHFQDWLCADIDRYGQQAESDGLIGGDGESEDVDRAQGPTVAYLSREHSISQVLTGVITASRNRLPMIRDLASLIVAGSIGIAKSGNELSKCRDDVNRVFSNICSKFSRLARSLVLATGELPHVTEATQKNICAILAFLEFMHELHDIPDEAIRCLRDLCEHCANAFAEATLQKCLLSIVATVKGEDWSYGDTDGLKPTKAPAQLKDAISSALQSIGTIYQSSPHSTNEAWLAITVGPRLLEMLRVFCDCVHQEVTVLSSHPDTGDPSSDGNARKQHPDDAGRRLLLLLNNVMFCRTTVAGDIWDQFTDMIPEFSMKSLNSAFSDLIDVILVLERVIIDAYVRRQALALAKHVERGTMLCGISWEDAPSAKDVRGYIFEILIHLVLVHEQLYSLGVDEDIASSILSQLVLQVALAFDFFISKIDRMNTVGSDQLTLEIEFFEFTVANLIAKRAETHGVLRRATGRLKSCIVGDSPSHSKHSSSRKELLDAAKASSAAMFECFSVHKPHFGHTKRVHVS
ncbi:unnamed protein product (mitochondrion) [Plasmodiophora brassicae]|uniref:Exocyst complex component n=1 Tax=Plasmodiophora brassicae TaxID=37360 RepID=A0A3P3YB62_PLABS|nr:unnamed protein product [Plasmodiophora brassicae]